MAQLPLIMFGRLPIFKKHPALGNVRHLFFFSVKVLAFLTHLPTAVLLAGPSERKSFQPSESKPRF